MHAQIAIEDVVVAALAAHHALHGLGDEAFGQGVHQKAGHALFGGGEGVKQGGEPRELGDEPLVAV